MDSKRKRKDTEVEPFAAMSSNIVPPQKLKRRLGGDLKTELGTSKGSTFRPSPVVVDLTSSPEPESRLLHAFRDSFQEPERPPTKKKSVKYRASSSQPPAYSTQESSSHPVRGVRVDPPPTQLPACSMYDSAPNVQKFLSDEGVLQKHSRSRSTMDTVNANPDTAINGNARESDVPDSSPFMETSIPMASFEPRTLKKLHSYSFDPMASNPQVSTEHRSSNAPLSVPEEAKPRKARSKKAKTEPELCQEQQDLVNLILSGPNVFYTGSAGCGKSTVLKAFVKQLRSQGKKVVIVAPTGRAALEVNGQTFFTFAGWVPDSFKKPIHKLREAAHGKFVRKRMKDVDVLVIDEISMMENYALERLNEVMQEARGKSKAFGGVQVVVTGDFCQLPPVKPFRTCITCGREMVERMGGSILKCPQHGEVVEIDKWAFRSSAWKQAEFQHVNLTTIHRQRDRKFIDILETLRMGKQLTEKDTDLLLNHKCNVKNAVKLYSTREEVRRINMEEFNKLPSETLTFKCNDHFYHNPIHGNLVFKAARDPNGSLEALREHKFDNEIVLKEGMLVILLVNLNIEEGLVNGSQGVVVGWEEYDKNKMPKAGDRPGASSSSKSGPSIPLLVNALTGEHAGLREANIKVFIHQAPKKRWPVVKFDNGITRTIYADCVVHELGDETPYSLLSRTQIPLLAGWAITVHKSQGMTLNRVVVDLSRSFEEGQQYVALSRARALNGLKVEGLGRSGGGGNEQVMEFLWEKFRVK